MIRLKFEDLCKRFERKYSVFMKMLQSKKELYFTYMQYPEQIRKHIYTTILWRTLTADLKIQESITADIFSL